MINCPVCNTKYEAKIHFCENDECGWEFKYFLSNLSNDMLEKEKKRLDIAVKNYQRIHETLSKINDSELNLKKALEDKDNEIARIRAETKKDEKPKSDFIARADMVLVKKGYFMMGSFIARADMVLVKKGSFMMGSNEYEDEKPIHKVDFTYDFYVSKYQVTQKEYQEIMGNNPSYFKGNNLPVEQITWYDAIKFCNELSKKHGLSVAYKEGNGELLDQDRNVTSDITKVKGIRLLTEAEWEYSSKGGNQSDGYKYSGSNNIDEVAWYYENSDSKTHEVGTKKPNELGLYDMSGNVCEWCTNFWKGNYSNSYNTNAVNLKESLYRVVRGGSWGYDAFHERSTNRYRRNPDNNSFELGFRFAKTF